jgi:ABC-type lipoprotein release transport system permease subunit
MHASTWTLAWRNLGRNRRRTALALLAIGVGQFALLATMGMMHGYGDNIRGAVTGPLVGHVQVHAPGWREDRAMDLVLNESDVLRDAILALDDVESAASRIYAPVLVAPAQDAFTAVAVGVEQETESRPFGLLSGLDTPLAPGEVLVGHRLARRIGAEPGREIALIGQAADGSIANDLFTVRDAIRCPVDLVNQSGIVMRIEDARLLFAMDGRAHELVVRATKGTDSVALATRIAALPLSEGTDVAPWQEVMPEFVLVLGMMQYVAYFVLVLVLIASLAGITNTLMMSTFERLHEIGMLLALGSRPARIVQLILAEALLLGLLGVIVGTVAGGLFVAVTNGPGIDMASWGGEQAADVAYKGLNLPLHIHPRLEPGDPLAGLVAVVLTSLLASLWPALFAARLEPMEAMRA